MFVFLLLVAVLAAAFVAYYKKEVCPDYEIPPNSNVEIRCSDNKEDLVGDGLFGATETMVYRDATKNQWCARFDIHVTFTPKPFICK